MASPTPATFVISIDLEMSWGAVHYGSPHDSAPYESERQVVADVLELMDGYGISATWAVVGHLFLDECRPANGLKHPEITRPDYPWLDGDWYDLDPALATANAPTWYGPDLVAAIRACPTPQEIGSHSFGHIIAGDPGCSAEAFRTDLMACRAVAEREGVALRSFVFPRNSVGHLDILSEQGFATYRSPTPERFSNLPHWQRRIAKLADTAWPLPSATFRVQRRGDLVDIPQTYLFDPDSKTAERFGTGVWSTLIRRRLRHAVRNSSLFHLWFHTHNLARRPDRARTAMEDLFREARRHIDAGRLENLTMGEVAAKVEPSSS